MRLTDLVRLDGRRYDAGATSLRRLVGLALRHPGFRAVALHRLGRAALGLGVQGRVQGRGRRVLAAGCRELSRQLCHCEISLGAELGPGLLLPHPTGVVIGTGVIVGPECTIQQNATLGGNYGRTQEGREMPELGARVCVSAGAVVAGPVRVGDGAIIGANAVVTRDVAAGARLAPPRPIELPPRSVERPPRAVGAPERSPS